MGCLLTIRQLFGGLRAPHSNEFEILRRHCHWMLTQGGCIKIEQVLSHQSSIVDVNVTHKLQCLGGMIQYIPTQGQTLVLLLPRQQRSSLLPPSTARHAQRQKWPQQRRRRHCWFRCALLLAPQKNLDNAGEAPCPLRAILPCDTFDVAQVFYSISGYLYRA